MTSVRVGGLKILEPLKADSSWGPLGLRNVDCGMRIEKENCKIRNPQFEIRNSIGRCSLSTRPLPPGHDPGIPEMSNSVSPPAEPGVYLTLNYWLLGIRSWLRVDSFRFMIRSRTTPAQRATSNEKCIKNADFLLTFFRQYCKQC